MNRFTHFELATTDLEKTAAFYREVFGWQVEKWEGPVEYWLVEHWRCQHPRHQRRADAHQQGDDRHDQHG